MFLGVEDDHSNTGIQTCGLASLPMTYQVYKTIIPILEFKLRAQNRGTWEIPGVEDDHSKSGIQTPNIELFHILSKVWKMIIPNLEFKPLSVGISQIC